LNAMTRVPFCGSTLDAVNVDGTVWVSVRRACESLGLAMASQHEKLKTAPWATIRLIVTVAEDGKARELFCVDLDSLPMWLATIDASRVSDEARPKLVRFFGSARPAAPEYPSARAALPDLVSRAVVEGDWPLVAHLASYLAACGVQLDLFPVATPAPTTPDPIHRARIFAAVRRETAAGRPVVDGIDGLAVHARCRFVRARLAAHALIAEGAIERRVVDGRSEFWAATSAGEVLQ